LYEIKYAICKEKIKTDIALQCKTNPKIFYKYVNSKFKNKNKIGNLNFKNNVEIEETTNNENTKAEILNNFFTSQRVCYRGQY